MRESGAGPPLRAALERTALVVRMCGRMNPGDVSPACARVHALLAASDADQVVCDLAALNQPDLATVDALARLTLAARRLGCRVHVRDAPPELRPLLEMLGLADVVPCPPCR
jgi:ABC-type transporter Mla MlaB component